MFRTRPNRTFGGFLRSRDVWKALMGVFRPNSVRASMGFDMGKDVFVVGFDTNRRSL
jgi:hypothetical protein